MHHVDRPGASSPDGTPLCLLQKLAGARPALAPLSPRLQRHLQLVPSFQVGSAAGVRPASSHELTLALGFCRALPGSCLARCSVLSPVVNNTFFSLSQFQDRAGMPIITVVPQVPGPFSSQAGAMQPQSTWAHPAPQKLRFPVVDTSENMDLLAPTVQEPGDAAQCKTMSLLPTAGGRAGWARGSLPEQSRRPLSSVVQGKEGFSVGQTFRRAKGLTASVERQTFRRDRHRSVGSER